jgi:Protein of unknown function (DUF1570)
MAAPFITFALALSLQIPPPGAAQTRITELRVERESARKTEAAKLEALAARLPNQADAKQVRDAIEPPEPFSGPIRFIPLHELVAPRPRPEKNLPEWRVELNAIRAQTVKKLIALAAKAAAPGLERFAIADECLRAVLARDPDQPDARRLLGFVPREGGGWATPHAIDLLKKDLILDPTYDWVPKEWVSHLRAGELPGKVFANGKRAEWLPAAQANALRGSIDNPWVINTTPHFVIKTDVPLDEAIAFGRRLEVLHDVFFSLFADVIGPSNLPLAKRYRQLDQKTMPKKEFRPVPNKQYEVFYFGDRDEYRSYLKERFGREEPVSLGLYLNPGMIPQSKKGRSFFFRDPNGQAGIDVSATSYHEASHQLLFESAGSTKFEDNRGNFWVWEGLGTYFETLVPQEDGSILLGGWVGPRLEQARIRLIDQKRFTPIAELAGMSKNEFLDEANGAVYDHYPQAMALVAFLMHYDRGTYREGFLDYVADAYRGKLGAGASKRALENHLGVPSRTLDEAFKKWLKGFPEDRPVAGRGGRS